MILGTWATILSAQSLPKNKVTLKPFGILTSSENYYNLGINYERYLDKKNQFSVDFGFDYYNLMGPNRGTSNHFTVGIFHHFFRLTDLIIV